MTSGNKNYLDSANMSSIDDSAHVRSSSNENAVSHKSSRSKILSAVPIIVSSVLISVLMIVNISFGDSNSNQGSSGEGTSSASISRMVKEMDILSSYTSISQSRDSARENNIALAVSAINGVLLKPNEVFSFNRIVGDTSNDPRYQESKTIDGYDVALTKGGGICQVTSTLYITALESNLEIAERHPHTVAQDYVPLGLDATVSYDELDFSFKNTMNSPVVITATSEGNTVTVTIYGTPKSDGLTYQTSSQIVDVSQSGDERYPGSIYRVNSYLSYYQYEDCAKRQLISTDSYYVASTSTFITKSNSADTK